jgi:hypothetical protein
MDPVIKRKAEGLVYQAGSRRERSKRIIQFVRDQILYCLDEWDVKPIDVLKKGRGMCAGKALLAAELHRAVSIPVRFKVIKIFGEEGLFDFLKQKLEEGALPSLLPEEREKIIKDILSLPPYRDHIVLQIVLDGERIDFDIARDTDLDNGMRALGIWKKREIFSEEGIFNSLDGWLRERMERRAVLQGRALFFQVVNQVIDEVRMKGRSTR